MATEKPWDPSEWPSPEQLDAWLAVAEPHERLNFCIDAIRSMQNETDRALRASVGSIGVGPVTIEDIGPVLDAIAAGQVPKWDELPPDVKMNLKNRILPEVLPGLEVFLEMVNVGVSSYMSGTEYRVTSDWKSPDGSKHQQACRTFSSEHTMEWYVKMLAQEQGSTNILVETRTVSEWHGEWRVE